ncbi:hypothetical protein BX666DRAFT_2029915 [Dichotomocladium elegans]|nr:hypothetical protein BX666DRAFT_2029915 [Dichotomocladium elegans]
MNNQAGNRWRLRTVDLLRTQNELKDGIKITIKLGLGDITDAYVAAIRSGISCFPRTQSLTASAYKRDKDGQLLWFAAPPVHVTPLPQPVHSVEYLEWKKRQKEKEHQHQQQQKQQQQKPDQQ